MPNVGVQLPASIGEYVSLQRDAFTGRAALVLAFRVVRPRFLLGGALDGDLEVWLQVLTVNGDGRWLRAREVLGFGAPIELTITLPFTGGDAVLVAPTQEVGEVRGWQVVGRRLETSVLYRVHLEGTPADAEVEVNAALLKPRP